jgi:hypothetical protein
MSGWTLFFVGLASLGLMAVAFGYVALTVYRLAKAGFHVARDYGPTAGHLAAKAFESQKIIERAGLHAEDIAANLTHLQATLTRLKIVAKAVDQALGPYQRLKTYFGR